MPTLYVPTSPLPPLFWQLVLLVNVPLGAVRGNTVLAAVTMSVPVQGVVVDWTAPHLAAVSTAMFKALSIQRTHPNSMIAKRNPITGTASNPNSTAAAPRLFVRSFIY